MPLTGWLDGLTQRQLEATASRYLDEHRALLVEWWGLLEVEPGDHHLASRLEIGDRAQEEIARENLAPPSERREWVVAKALIARPVLFAALLTHDD